MSDDGLKQDRIRGRIAASQKRLERDSAHLPAVPSRPLPKDAYPPEDWRGLAKDHPWLLIAAGAGVGLLAGALLPRRAGSKGVSRALSLAATGAELAIALSKSARDAASDGIEQLDESTAPLRRKAGRAADGAARSARSTGLRVVGEAARLASRLRR